MRPAACGWWSRARASCARAAPSWSSPSPAPSPSSSTRATRPVTCGSKSARASPSTPPASPPAWSERLVAAFAEQADEARRAVVADDHRGAGPVRRAVGMRAEEVRLIDPRAGVEDARAGRRHPLPGVVRGPRAGTVRVPEDDVRGADVEALDHLADAAQIPAAQR